MKGNTIANSLVKNAIHDYKAQTFNFPNKDIMQFSEDNEPQKFDNNWKMCFDGTINLSGNEIMAVIII